MTWSNYDDVLAQLRSLGLVVDTLEVGKLTRCRVDKDRERRGWYSLHELRLDSGSTVLVGSFGLWRGAEANAQKVELKKTQLSADQKIALRERIRQDQRVAEAERKRVAERAGERARRAWEQCATDGAPPYLQRKSIAAHGTRVSPAAVVVVPMLDTSGRIHGLQFIHAQKRGTRDKDFWPPGCAKQGHFFQLGPVPSTVLLIAEGYATAASLFEATGYPVAVAFDAGNLQPVAQALAKRYPKARILVCADDDYLTDGNPGCTKAAAAALAVDGAWLAPTFANDRAGKKHTDFNDLHALEGLQQVRVQVEAKLRLQQWLGTLQPPAHAQGAGDADDNTLRKIQTPAELHERFALIYGMGGFAFDRSEHQIIPLTDVRNLCAGSWIGRDWMGSADQAVVRKTEVDFDPAGTDPSVKCNLFGGWPTTPQEGSCETLLELLHYLCSHEKNSDELYGWVLKWLAYPVQHPGAKMRSALVFHGPQGTGKNMFFEAYMAVYGDYGGIVDQAAVEDKFNDWASRKLFLIADEVVARLELWHTKNKLKHFITGEWVRINPKNLGAHKERNHVNLVFLSNETQPLVLERDDRRYAVIWTPPKRDAAFYEAVRQEIADGGVAALHHHLLHNVDVSDFRPWSLPPMTDSKADLIELGLDSTERFWTEWLARDVPLPLCAARTEDLFDAYRHWCHRNGVAKPAPLSIFIGNCAKRPGAVKDKWRHHIGWAGGVSPQCAVMLPPGADQPAGIAARTEPLLKFREAVRAWRTERSNSEAPA